ncbi:prolyl oligopeptidase family serine peptidase [Metabacillus sp. GX 13764]|uniref:alpha/beta hydrolase family protein n=1 Tax=Metabacillus kandeliae TaxID=2900151 RepID=UPI001E5829FD|nr:prolyl oligopeptidase family serine peptidase [Metabacillus kandeliae]MCD7032630.1 prolyl oligopeptidase family serine peptidase [Metabacillus kandeliae]
MKNGDIIEKIKFPSPNPKIDLYSVTYFSSGLKVKGMLAEPKAEGEYEGFLYLRGGIKNVGQVRPGRLIQFASEGFVVFAPHYRGNQGGEGNEDFAGDDRNDALGAMELLKNHSKTAAGRVHVFGFSRGGVMALLTGILDKDTCSIVTWGGVSDMVLTYDEREDLRRMMKRVIGGTPSKYPDRYEWRTPLYHLDALLAPVLIIHGEKDGNVSFEHAARLDKRLKELGKHVETLYYKDYTHYFPPAENRRVVQKLTQWMKSR